MDENYGKCSYCDEKFDENKWCRECDLHRIIERWTSDVSIDKFIKDTMYEARNGSSGYHLIECKILNIYLKLVPEHLLRFFL